MALKGPNDTYEVPCVEPKLAPAKATEAPWRPVVGLINVIDGSVPALTSVVGVDPGGLGLVPFAGCVFDA